MKSILITLGIGFCATLEIAILLACQYLYSYGPDWIMVERSDGVQILGFATGLSMTVACIFPFFLAFALCIGIVDIDFKEFKQ